MTIDSNTIFPTMFNNDFRDIVNHKFTEYCEKGGRGSCKSSFLSIAIIWLMVNNPDFNALVLRKVADTLSDSVYEQLLWAIDVLGLTDRFKATKSPLRIIYTKTGQRIIFRGADEPKKIKSIKLKRGYFAITWFEELTEFSAEDVETIKLSTMRGGDKFWIFYSFNPPSSARNWCNEEFKVPRKNTLIHRTDYRGVPKEWLGEAFFDEALSLKERNERAYRNIFLGEPTGTGRNVFENVTLREITQKEIDSFDYCFYGIDWGYYPDPFAYVQMAYNPAKKTLYIFDELELLKHGNEQASNALEEHLLNWYGTDVNGYCEVNYKNDRIVADSAEDKSIGDFIRYGWNIKAAIKGPHSREPGYKWLQSLNEIVIDPARAPHSADEFSLYEYEIDRKSGEILSGYPEGQADHCMSAVRYAMESVWRRRGG